MAHDLVALTSGLASRVNNLAVLEAGKDSRTLLEAQERLTKLSMVAIVKDLQAEDAAYQAAVSGLNDAIDYIGEADKKLDDIGKAIGLVAKAISLVEKALGIFA